MNRADWMIYAAVIALAVITTTLFAALGSPYLAGMSAGAGTVLGATHAAASSASHRKDRA